MGLEDQFLNNLEKKLRPVNVASSIIATLVGIGLGYVFYVENIYRPNVQLISVDYQAGVAVLKVGHKEKTLYEGSTISVGPGSWGVRFSDGSNLSRIELVKNDLVYKVISIKK